MRSDYATGACVCEQIGANGTVQHHGSEHIFTKSGILERVIACRNHEKYYESRGWKAAAHFRESTERRDTRRDVVA
jgi:hypothetical protein